MYSMTFNLRGIPAAGALVFSAGLFTPQATAQCLVDQEFPSPSDALMQFGNDIAMDGSTVLVGAFLSEGVGIDNGAVYEYELSAAGLVFKSVWHHSDPGAADRFGASVAVHGTLAAVGAIEVDTLGIATGAVYIFEQAGSNWGQTEKIFASDFTGGSWFGHATGIRDAAGVRTISIGAPQMEPFNTIGAVYVFESNGGPFGEVDKILASDLANLSRFGETIDVVGDWMVVGSPGASFGGVTNGAVYVFQYVAGAWTEVAKIGPADPKVAAEFGIEVDLDGDTLIVGSRKQNGAAFSSGAAYVFTRSGSTWTEVAKLSASDGSTNDRFGESVAISEGVGALVGASRNGHFVGGGGSAYYFTESAGTWTETRLTVSDGENDEYGRQVAMSSTDMLISAPAAELNGTGDVVGTLYHRVHSGSDCNSNGVPDTCDIELGTSLDQNSNGVPDECECVAANYCTSTPNSSGGAAQMSLTGSTSIGDNDFHLSAGPLPNSLGIFYYGTQPVSIPFGNGTRCVGGSTFRLPVLPITGNSLEFTFDLTTAPPAGAITDFDTYYFQAWFRDPPVGAGFDLSDGLEVTFCP